jgi:hypothetical protein
MSDATTVVWIAAGSAIGGGLVAGLLSGAYQHLREYASRPILKIDFADDDSHKVESSEQSSEGTEAYYVYIRVRVRNAGRQVARGCRVFLVYIEEVHPSGQTTRTVFHESRQLAWAGFKFVPTDLPAGLDFYSDILRVSKDVSGWVISVEQLFANERSLKSYEGTYRFHLAATCDNAELAWCVVDVSYAGNWRNLRAVAVRFDSASR